MADLFDYMSWNLQQFGDNHEAREVLMGVRVGVWIAGVALDLQTTVFAAMEVALVTGEAAIREVTNAFNLAAAQRSPDSMGPYFHFEVSERSASVRADKYAVIYCIAEFTQTMSDDEQYTFKPVSVTGATIESGKDIPWGDRAPFFWVTGTGKSAVNTLAWHAPQPSNHLKAVTIGHLGMLVDQLAKKTKRARFCISGDFNFDTGRSDVYAPLTDRGFTGAFDGELTTLTTLQSFIANNPEKFVNPDQYTEAFLANAYDNLFVRVVSFENHLRPLVPNMILDEIMTNPGYQIVTRSKAAEALTKARRISDHLPLVATISG